MRYHSPLPAVAVAGVRVESATHADVPNHHSFSSQHDSAVANTVIHFEAMPAQFRPAVPTSQDYLHDMLM